MTYVLGKLFKAGRYKVAVVSRQAVDGRRLGGKGVALACHKEPAFVVLQEGEDWVVLDMMGAEVPLSDVAKLCPAVTVL